MIKINITAVGRLKEKYWRDSASEYAKRLRPYCQFSVTELAEEKLPHNPSETDIANIIFGEGKKILNALPKKSFVIALCVEGKMLSSESFAKKIEEIYQSAFGTVTFIIGGSYGLSPEVKQAADLNLSVSKMTFPHQMVRILLCEQIYRAFQILNNGKYHK